MIFSASITVASVSESNASVGMAGLDSPSTNLQDSALSFAPGPMNSLLSAGLENGYESSTGYVADEEGQAAGLPRLALRKQPKSVAIFKKVQHQRRRTRDRIQPKCRKWIQRIYSDTPFKVPIERPNRSIRSEKKGLHLLKSFKAEFLVDLCQIEQRSRLAKVETQAEECAKLFQVMSSLMEEYHEMQAQYQKYSPTCCK